MDRVCSYSLSISDFWAILGHYRDTHRHHLYHCACYWRLTLRNRLKLTWAAHFGQLASSPFHGNLQFAPIEPKCDTPATPGCPGRLYGPWEVTARFQHLRTTWRGRTVPTTHHTAIYQIGMHTHMIALNLQSRCKCELLRCLGP